MFSSLSSSHLVARSAPQAARRRLLGLVPATMATALLAACAGPARIAGEGPAFERTGRFAVNVTETGVAPQAVQGGFAWRDTGRVLRLDLANPLGSTLARVVVEPAGAVLEYADGSTESAPNADALIAQVMGAALPVAELRDWLQGRVGTSNTQNMARDDQGRPESFSQGGWQLRFSRYDSLGPGLLRLERRDGARHISVRLVVDTQAR